VCTNPVLDPLIKCANDKCKSQYDKCVKDATCKKVIECAAKCSTYTCMTQCAWGKWNKAVNDIGNCMSSKGCLSGGSSSGGWGGSSGGGGSGGSSTSSGGGSSGGSSSSSGGNTQPKPCKKLSDCKFGQVCCKKNGTQTCLKAGDCW